MFLPVEGEAGCASGWRVCCSNMKQQHLNAYFTNYACLAPTAFQSIFVSNCKRKFFLFIKGMHILLTMRNHTKKQHGTAAFEFHTR